MDILDQFRGFCSTPSIFSADSEFPYPSFEFPEVEISPELETQLLDLSHPRNSVLGKRMESFFELAVKYSERYELIASNIQIIDEGRTLGELDFLVFDRFREKVLHVELIYKLYIFDPANPEMGWIGPNRRDSFFKKSDRLRKHQFPLLYKDSTRSYLEKLGLKAENIEQQVCFKAKLFPSEKDANLSGINSECITGHWMRQNDLVRLDSTEVFHSPKKVFWSCKPENNKKWLSKEEIAPQLRELCNRQKSPLVWKKTGLAYQSFFVVWW